MAVSVYFADRQQRQLSRETARGQVQEDLGQIRARIEANINTNIDLLQGFIALISVEPDFTQERFSKLAERLLETHPQIRNIVAGPGMVTSFVYPYERNKSFIGRKILGGDASKELAAMVREQHRIAIDGPVTLKNGGHGLIVTLPILADNGHGGRRFWGALAGIVDLARLYADSGLTASDGNIHIAISRSVDGSGRKEVIYGADSVLEGDPVAMTIDLGHEAWTIAAIPDQGWDALIAPPLLFHIVIGVITTSIAGSVLWVARLVRQRQKNLSALREREAEIRAVSQRLELALETSNIGVWEMDLRTNTLNWDSRMHQLYGIPESDGASFERWRDSLHPNDRDLAREAFRRATELGEPYVTEFRITRHGEVRHIRTVGSTYTDHAGNAKILGVNWDVTGDIRLQEELRAAQQRAEHQNAELENARLHMEHNALHDALTGLPNRRYLDQHLAALNATEGNQSRVTVLHVDLDRFKEINDTLGHGAGDAMLRHVATELRHNVRNGDFIARIGGDEFVIVCQNALRDEEFTDTGRRLIAAINKPIFYNGHECRVGASVGIATNTDASTPAEQLLVNADIALYEAKRHGRNRVERFNDHLRARTINIKTTADAILRSLNEDDFIAYYQPQFDARTLEINGVEALARWRHPKKGILAPIAFLEIAESLNVVAQIDASILNQSLQQLSRWQEEGLAINHVSVNISAQRLFEDKLLDHLANLAIKPGTLSFELLESISFDDKADAVAESLNRIRAHGIAIEIDDFGTGYASILSLIKLSPTRLKIDRQLVAPIVNNPAQRKLISSIVDIGRSFGIGIVAEGVETMEHAAILRDLGCQTLQGYALARPMGPDAFINFAKAHALKREELWQRSA
jgi:diguanylate cyclase (GGDEF)-like protein/PAS domain S-box-containing protein